MYFLCINLILNLRVYFLIHVLTPKQKWWFCPYSSSPHLVPSTPRVYVSVYIYIYSIYNVIIFYVFYYNSPKHSSFCLSRHYNHHPFLFLSSQSYQYWSHLIRDNKMPSPRPNSTSPAPTPTNFPHQEKGLRRVIQSSTALLPPSDVKHLSS